MQLICTTQLFIPQIFLKSYYVTNTVVVTEGVSGATKMFMCPDSVVPFVEVDIQVKIRRAIQDVLMVPFTVAWCIVGWNDIYYPIWFTCIIIGKYQVESDHHPLLDLFLKYCIYTYLAQEGFFDIKKENFFGLYHFWPQRLPNMYERVMNNFFRINFYYEIRKENLN